MGRQEIPMRSHSVSNHRRDMAHGRRIGQERNGDFDDRNPQERARYDRQSSLPTYEEAVEEVNY